MNEIPSLADWVRRRRKALDMTQDELAERVGCAVVTIKKIEQHLRQPSREMAILLADQLAIPQSEREKFLRLARSNSKGKSPAISASIELPEFLLASPDAPNHFQHVGREQELNDLESHLVATLNGSGRIVFIAGEAGQGKTSLMAEFARRAQAHHSDLIVAKGNCDAYVGVGDPYLPFRDILGLLTGDVKTKLLGGVLSQEQARRLWRLLPQSAKALVDYGSHLINVFVSGTALLERCKEYGGEGMDIWDQLRERVEAQHSQHPPLQQRQLFEQYTQVLTLLSVRQPLLLLLDDLQWSDSASASLLFHLGRRLLGTRILILAAYRPSEMTPAQDSTEREDAHPIGSIVQEFKRRFGDVEVDLEQLAPESDRAFVDALLDREPNLLDGPFRETLFQRTHGHPFFTVELLREMQERRDLVRDDAGMWVAGPTVDWETLPARVEAVIARHIGRLPEPLQEALKVASVEGESFIAEAIAKVQGIDGQRFVRQLSTVADRTHKLVHSEGPERRGYQVLSHYRFSHSLYQSYLYGCLDATELIYLHEALGHALEEIYVGRTEEIAVQLAYHFRAAELLEGAIGYLQLAAERAMRFSAHGEAIVHLCQALTLLERLPKNLERDRCELRLQLALGMSFNVTEGWSAPEVERVYRQALTLCEQVGDATQLSSALWGLHNCYRVRGEVMRSYELGEQSLRVAQEQNDPVLLEAGYFMVGGSLFHQGELSASHALLERNVTLYHPTHHHAHVTLYGPDFGVFSCAYFAHILWHMGYVDQALEQGQNALHLARQLSHPFSLAVALSYLAMVTQCRREPEATLVWTKLVIDICTKYEFRYYLVWANFLYGWTLAEQGDLEQGIGLMQQSLLDLQVMGTALREPYYLALLAQAEARAGRVEDGLRRLADALTCMERTDERYYEAEIHRLRGEFFRMQGKEDEESERCFWEALFVARRQQAKALELRAAKSLALLWQAQGRRKEAHALLAPVYNWFSSGFDTADVSEAKRLLDELS